MKVQPILWALFIVLVILLIYQPPLLTGFWVAGDEFKRNAGVDSMLFYFGKNKGYAYEGFISIKADGKEVYNDMVRFKIMGKTPYPSSCMGMGCLASSSKLFIEWDSNAMPSSLDMVIKDGKMMLTSEGTLYATLYRDNHMSDTAVLEYQPPDSE